jgi:hypothetical protein
MTPSLLSLCCQLASNLCLNMQWYLALRATVAAGRTACPQVQPLRLFISSTLIYHQLTYMPMRSCVCAQKHSAQSLGFGGTSAELWGWYLCPAGYDGLHQGVGRQAWSQNHLLTGELLHGDGSICQRLIYASCKHLQEAHSCKLLLRPGTLCG